MVKDYKLDIFDVMRNIDVKNRGYYSSLSDEEKKALAPIVIMRWMTGIGASARQVYFMNEIVNPYVFSLHRHPELLVKLMMVCTGGRKSHYKWRKREKKNATGTSKLVELVCSYFGYSKADASDALPLLSDDDLLSYAVQLGYQPDELKTLKRDMKKRVKV